MRYLLLALVGLLSLGAGAQKVAAQDRIALLIGNQAYQEGVGALKNPINDITLVGEALKRVGFQVLEPVTDGSRADILIAVNDFAAKLAEAGDDAIGFLYYSGHGIAVSGENYILPVEITRPTNRQLRVNGVRLNEILETLRTDAPKAAHYLVFDACRTNLRGRRGGKGFLPVAEQSGALIAFAAEPGKTASDFGDESGPYAAALAAELTKPGQDDLDMFHNVRIAVSVATEGEQIPWTSDGILRPERPYFAGREHPLPEADIREAQRLLKQLGFDPGEVDGKMGPNTRDAVSAFQRQAGLDPTATLSGELLALLRNYSTDDDDVQNPDIVFREDIDGKLVIDSFYGPAVYFEPFEPSLPNYLPYYSCPGDKINLFNQSKKLITLNWAIYESDVLDVETSLAPGGSHTVEIVDMSLAELKKVEATVLVDLESGANINLIFRSCEVARKILECLRVWDIGAESQAERCMNLSASLRQ